jgi:hypothetical protein
MNILNFENKIKNNESKICDVFKPFLENFKDFSRDQETMNLFTQFTLKVSSIIIFSNSF